MFFFSQRGINCNYERIVECLLNGFYAVIKIGSMNGLVKISQKIKTGGDKVFEFVAYHRTKTVSG